MDTAQSVTVVTSPTLSQPTRKGRAPSWFEVIRKDGPTAQIGSLGLAVLVFALIVSCGCHVTSERLIVGSYRAEAPCETITLVLSLDHSFVQSVRAKSGDTNQLTGKWAMDGRGAWVDFQPFLDFREDGHGREVGGASFVADMMPRGISMGPVIVKCPGSDHEIDYVK